MGLKWARYEYFSQARPLNPFPNQKHEKMDFSVFPKNTPILDWLDEKDPKSPEMAPKTPQNGPHINKNIQIFD